MNHVDFEYVSAGGGGGAMAASVFADRPQIRAEMREDAEAAGLTVPQVGALETVLEGQVQPRGEIVLLDCPVADARTCAALMDLDVAAERTGTELIVSTILDSMEGVFGCFRRSQPQILVDPTRADRLLAIGRVTARGSAAGVRELSQEDRFALMRIFEQVGQIAEQLGKVSPNDVRSPSLSNEPEPEPETRETDPAGASVARPGLPDAGLIRQIIRHRQVRARFFDAELFADPVWDMLLDLTAARVEGAKVSVTSLCIASGVPPTTALRWINQMTRSGLLNRLEDPNDRRRAFMELTESAADSVARYFADIGGPASPV